MYYYRPLRRIRDIFGSLLLLCMLVPFFILIIPLLAISGDGEIFFLQRRIGYKNKFFSILKFATMFKGSEKFGTLTLKNDPRVTYIGSFLRKTKLNEVPQIINVLRGEMSFVGPRPQGEFEFEAYPPHVRKKIYDCVPGITGIGSIVFRDEEKFFNDKDVDPKIYYKEVIAPYKGEIELWYRNHQTFFVDLKILLLTVWVIINPNDDEMVYSVFKSIPRFRPQLASLKNFTKTGLSRAI